MAQIYLGTVTTDGEALALPPLTTDMDVDAIKAAIVSAELAKREAAKRESAALKGVFLGRLALEPEPGEK